jgi:energy-coupling factor transport system substrate-specific component
MKSIFGVWKDTKSVVLIAVSAAIYAASLIPFKALVIIPGSTEIRPGAVFPPVLGLMFGPAGAWGSAIGNTIADIFGMFGPGTIPGFFGNFFYAYVPFLLWNRIWGLSTNSSPDFKNFNDIAQFVVVAILASLACAVIIGWGGDVMGLFPFATLTPIILINNSIVSIVLGPFLMRGLFQRVKKWGLLCDDFSERKPGITLRQKIGVFLVITGLIGAIGAGYFLLLITASPSHFSANVIIMLFLILFIAGVVLI